MTTNQRRVSTGGGRKSAADGLFALGESIESASEMMAASFAPVRGPSSPDRHTAAISAIEDDEGLSEDEFVEAVGLVMDVPKFASTYLAIKSGSARTRFLTNALEKRMND